MAQNDGAMRPPGAMSLTGDLASGWVRWIERFQFYILATAHFSSVCLQNKPVDMLTETVLSNGLIVVIF